MTWERKNKVETTQVLFCFLGFGGFFGKGGFKKWGPIETAWGFFCFLFIVEDGRH